MISSKRITLRTLASGAELHIRVYSVRGRDPTARTAYIQSSMHGSEVQGNAVIAQLLEHFAASPPQGNVVLVPNANPYGINQKGGEYTMGRFDPTTGDNWNRAYFLPQLAPPKALPWPELSRRYRAALGAAVRRELRGNIPFARKLALTLQSLALAADYVLDLHCANNSARHLYAPEYAQDCARYLGIPLILSVPDAFGGALDEAQNIKNPGTAQSRAVRALRSTRRAALTGTPLENRLSELKSILDFLNPGLLGSDEAFRRTFAIPIERHHDPVARERLRRLTAPFLLRRTKTDPAIAPDLPDKIETKEWVGLSREQATLYRATTKALLEGIGKAQGQSRRAKVLLLLLRLKQICNHPALFLGDGSRLDGRSSKLTRLLAMLEETEAESRPALLFTQFSEMGHLLVRALRDKFDKEVLFLHGGVPRLARAEMVRRFQEDDDPPLFFVLSLKAGGAGLNLTRASHVFHVDRWWNPAVEDQATDRAFRIGQTRHVQVHKFVCRGTLEERIDGMIDEKKELARSIIGAGESWITELSNEELAELVALSRDAVESGEGA